MKIEKLNDRARKNLNIMCTTLGYNFPLGDWINAVNEALVRLSEDTGVTEDYEDLRTDQ